MWPFTRRKKKLARTAGTRSLAHPASIDGGTTDPATPSSFWYWWASGDAGSSASSSADSPSTPTSDWGTSTGGDFGSADAGGGCGGSCGGGGGGD